MNISLINDFGNFSLEDLAILSKLGLISLKESCQSRKGLKMDLTVSLMEKINEFGYEGIKILKIWNTI